MKKLKILLISALLFVPLFVFADNSSSLPMSFYGRAELNGVALPVGSVVQVFADGFLRSEAVVDDNGYYAVGDSAKAKLSVAQYSSGQLVFKYFSAGLDSSVAGNSNIVYLSAFKAGKTIQLDLPFVENMQMSVTPNFIDSDNGVPLSCSDVVYGSWGGCLSGLQSRDVIGKIPDNCVMTLAQESAKTQVCSVSTIPEKGVLGIKITSDQGSESQKTDNSLLGRVKGRVLLQVESRGESWYVNPKDSKRYYLANGEEAFKIMRYLGIGISNKNLDRIKNDPVFARKNAGKIFLQVEANGEAWYVGPKDNKLYYLQDGRAAYQIMRQLSLGVTNADLKKIEAGNLMK
jgi:hypothetical protein